MGRPAQIFLTGFMGSGKTTIGRALAQRLSWRFVDLDQKIEQQAQHTIAEIFSAFGEKGFRKLESEVLEKIIDSLAADRPAVVALGGGTYVQQANRKTLRRIPGDIIYLEAENVESLMKRFHQGRVRPLAQDPENVRRLFEQRRAIYQTADLSISTSNKSVEEIVTEIISRLGLSKIRRLK